MGVGGVHFLLIFGAFKISHEHLLLLIIWKENK